MIKLTVLYGSPVSAEQCETHYRGTHLPLAAKIKGVARVEFTKFVEGPDGAKPPFYRMAELYFTTQAQMEQSLSSPEGQAAVADIQSFATGGVTMATGTVDA